MQAKFYLLNWIGCLLWVEDNFRLVSAEKLLSAFSYNDNEKKFLHDIIPDAKFESWVLETYTSHKVPFQDSPAAESLKRELGIE